MRRAIRGRDFRIMGIAFDLEGTVVDVERAHHLGHLEAAQEVGLTISLSEAYKKLRHFIGGPDEKVCEDIWNLLPTGIQTVTHVSDLLVRDQYHYNRLLKEMPIEPRPGFLQFYGEAHALGLKLTIGSLTPENQAKVLLERSGLGQLFGESNIVLREHVQNYKPAPDVFVRTAGIMGIDPCEQLVFEDSPRGVRAALAAGSKAVGMPVVLQGVTAGALIDAGVSALFYDWRHINVPGLLQAIG